MAWKVGFTAEVAEGAEERQRGEMWSGRRVEWEHRGALFDRSRPSGRGKRSEGDGCRQWWLGWGSLAGACPPGAYGGRRVTRRRAVAIVSEGGAGEKDQSLAVLATLGGSTGNQRLRRRLEWDETTYERRVGEGLAG